MMEKDPHGKAPHEAGSKLDAGKNRLGLVLGGFANALQEVGKVGTYGANKYSDNGWMEVVNGQDRYTDAMLRHVFKDLAGEDRDPDSGLLHASHAAWNALARLELVLRDLELKTVPSADRLGVGRQINETVSKSLERYFNPVHIQD